MRGIKSSLSCIKSQRCMLLCLFNVAGSTFSLLLTAQLQAFKQLCQ